MSADSLRRMLRELPVFATELPAFDPATAPAEPVDLFVPWLREAIEVGVTEPHVMTLSTVDADGRPNARVLILKGVDGDAWHFATTAVSAKGRELETNASAALTFYWPRLGRQVRVVGRVETATPEESAADFLARSPSARAEVLLGRQGQPVTDRARARADLGDAVARIEADPSLVDERWRLYRVIADRVEFFQASPDRWHTRLRYERGPQGWTGREIWA